MTEMLDDPLLWLEEIDDSAVMDWVKARNAETEAALAGTERFNQLRAEILRVLDCPDRIPYPIFRGDHLYNLWRDEEHPRGLWRRATLAEFRRDRPRWEVLLDLDALAAAEGESWVWQGATGLRPHYQRYLISLSRGGADACVVREFDIGSGTFVAGGFTLPEAKSVVAWIDLDHVYVGTDAGPGSLTSSGLPRMAKRWRRGTPIEAATTVFEGDEDDVAVQAWHDPTPGFQRDFVERSLDFYRSRRYLRRPTAELVLIDVPEDAVVDVHREWLLVRLRSDWTVNGVVFAAGALLVAELDRFLAGDRALTPLFEPDARTVLSYHAWTRRHLILATLVDVRGRLEVLTAQPDGWRRELLAGGDERTHDVADTNPDDSDEYLLTASSFTEPATLRYGHVGGGSEQVKQEPAWFDPATVTVRQNFATSADGTRVPYFVVGDPDATGAPTLLTGYGGFEISFPPSYDGVIGRGWLARGGTYVVANIRGGGEYGAPWHRAAMRENRPRAFEDFAAVARDLVARGITSRARLGISGGSNGGLLMGVMLTSSPELFGAVVAKVPLFDMRRYHTLLAGASWMAEYGDPDDEADWAFLRAYSPYHNVYPERAYPPLLIITSTRDDRVHPGHARKMAARLRAHGYDVSYYENIEGGHGAAADNAQLAYQQALMLEFLWQRLGR